PADFQIRYTDQDHDAVALNNGDSMKGYDIFNDGVSAAPATSAIVCEGAPGDDSITIDTVTIEGKTAGASGDNIAIGMNLDLNCPSSVSNSTIDQTAFGVIAGGQTPASRTFTTVSITSPLFDGMQVDNATLTSVSVTNQDRVGIQANNVVNAISCSVTGDNS